MSPSASPRHRTGPAVALALLLLLGIGCGSDGPAEDDWALAWCDTLLVASFNLENIGPTKLSDPVAVSAIVDVIRTFDIIALQEVRGSADLVYTSLVRVVNGGSDNGPYRFVSGPQVGSGSYFEQYGFIYDATRVAHTEGDWELYPDHGEAFARPPLLARFSTLAGFDFVLADVHISPDDAQAEIDELVYVMKYGRDRWPSQKDVIILGDLNADCSYFSEEGNLSPLRQPHYRWVIGDELDTTTAKSSYTYDRIVFDRTWTDEDFTGNHGVLRIDEVFGFSAEVTDAVSNHSPVWAEFSTSGDTD